MTHLIARISNRVIVGKELCRNEGFIHAAVTFAESLMMTPFIQWSPLFLRPCVSSFFDLLFDIKFYKRLVYLLLSSIFGGKKGALKYVLPHLKKYAKERSNLDEKPVVFLELFSLVSGGD